MITFLLAVGMLICAVGWITRYISCNAMIYYMAQKGYTLPTDNEIKECTAEAVKHLFK